MQARVVLTIGGGGMTCEEQVDPDGKIHTYIWDGTDYLGEV